MRFKCFWEGFSVELEDGGVEGIASFWGEVGAGVDCDDVREQGRANGVAVGLATRENGWEGPNLRMRV